jgi:hypothetical protein
MDKGGSADDGSGAVGWLSALGPRGNDRYANFFSLASAVTPPNEVHGIHGWLAGVAESLFESLSGSLAESLIVLAERSGGVDGLSTGVAT